MIGVVLVVAVALAQIPPSDPGRSRKAVVPESSRAIATPRAEWVVRKAKLADTIEGHTKLGLWCEQNGMKAEAEAEFAAVLRIDPNRDSAWKHLGYKKHRGRWMNDAEIADEAEQLKADRHWIPVLGKLHDGLHDKRAGRRDAARAAILKIEDPRAVTAIWLALAAGGSEEQSLVATALDALPGDPAAHAMAILTITGKSPEVRRQAIDALKKRKPTEFGPPLVALIRPPMRYEVTPVDGPGSVGVLMVEGKKHDTRRLYAPSPAPVIESQPGDIVTLDEFGLPQINRGGGNYTAIYVDERGNPIDTSGMDKIKVGQNEVEALRAADDAARQLDQDVAVIEAINLSIKNTNDRAIDVLQALTKEHVGTDPQSWRKWLAKAQGKESAVERTRSKKVVTDFVTLTYEPTFSVAQPRVAIMTGSGKSIANCAPS